MTATIHPTAIVDPACRLGDEVEIGPYCIVDEHVTLGDRTRLVSHVTVSGRTEIGADCLLYPQVSMGYPPQDFKHRGEGDIGIRIGDRCTFREMVNVHPGTDVGKPRTVIGDDCYFMVGSHLAHECQVGDNVTLSNYVQVGGNVSIGDYTTLGGLAAIHQHTRIGNYAFVAGMALVTNDVIPYGLVMGNSAHLNGLNVVGLRRRGFGKAQIHKLRAAYRQLFAYEGTLAERVEDATRLYSDEPLVMEIIEFIMTQSNGRNLTLPDMRR
ncbi:acyl-ACP--UDP-N-acetylglucosamine O-acyltransferase [uncultured Algimonas sp.]|uniref:acyl-ACP--UDP-N-acetylglucosamine O-acyltransferase n=1 Tax=uncultured Algimonas sp. TaxID=1547920 RepID=UPI002606E453|nr:acyl-ACP--UDP-N-acetylglucosamine O-acyltransferase [uncultured Algimonas sp.]